MDDEVNDIDFADLYQEVIVDHSRRPRNFGRREGATHSAEGCNPLCGDRLPLGAQSLTCVCAEVLLA